MFPGPHYQRAYCLLYRATEPGLGFRHVLPGGETAFTVKPMNDRSNTTPVLPVERAMHRFAPGAEEADYIARQQRLIDAWRRRPTGGLYSFDQVFSAMWERREPA